MKQKPTRRRQQKLPELLDSRHSLAPYIRNSYVLSRFWAWLSRIRLSPHVSIPIPRALSQRDP